MTRPAGKQDKPAAGRFLKKAEDTRRTPARPSTVTLYRGCGLGSLPRAATDTARAPWYIAHTDDTKHGRLNIISHLLSQVPYKPLAHRDITLPKRQRAGGYTEPDLPLRYIPTLF